MKRKNFLEKYLSKIEKIGSALPHPATIFFILSVLLVITSHICYMFDLSCEFSIFNKATNSYELQKISAISLLDKAGIRFILESMISNFTSFAPLGAVLVAMLGIGIAEGSGLISCLLKRIVLVTPHYLVTSMVVFLGVISNIASDAGYIVLVPLGAIIFLNFGRHPLAGLAAAFAGVSGGYSANIVIGSLEPLLAGITQEAARFVQPEAVISPADNFYFLFVSTFLITIIGAIVTEKIIEPHLGKYQYKKQGIDNQQLTSISSSEKSGLIWAGFAFLATTSIIALTIIPTNGILRGDAGEIIGNTPFFKSIIVISTLFFLIPGIAYGIGAKTVKNDKDLEKFLSQSMSSMGGYIVIAFVASQFIAYFSYSKLGIILAVSGANLLKSINLTGLPLIIIFILISSLINLFIGSASAKWAIMAPIFVPMFMQLGYSAEFTQLSYRIGDSTTNIISPLMPYFAIIIAFAEKYDKKHNIGKLIALMLPYSIAFLIGWIILLTIWFILGLPIGPTANILLPK